MLRQWLQCLPDHLSNGWLLVAAFGAIAGLVLWVAGARFSRLLIGLAAVTIGGAVGMNLPRYMNWNIGGAGPAVALALAFGVSGYVMQRLWIGMLLGVVLASWAFLVTWTVCGATSVTATTTAMSTSSFDAWWKSLPPTVADHLPYTCGTAFAAGVLLALIWPRLAIATAWSAAGVSLIAALGSAAMASGRPQWIRLLPQHLGPQLVAVLFLVGIGVLLQWKMAGRLAGYSPSPAPSQGD